MSERQTALITGASGGIGLSLARLFARDGYDVVLVARRREALEPVARAISEAHGVRAATFAADLSRQDGVMSLLRHLEAESLHVDALVNNAGFGLRGRFDQLPLDRQMEMIDLNVSALTALTRELVPGMLARRRGGILNVGSAAGFQPGPFMAVYYATKAYVVSFTEALAEELSGTGLRVCCLAPGPTATGFAERAHATDSQLFRRTMDVEAVAREGYEGWRSGRVLVMPGLSNRVRYLGVRMMPRAFVRRVVRRLNE